MKKDYLRSALTDNERSKFWIGYLNKFVRYYFYTQRGLALLNEFRYLIMAILAVYALLDLKNPFIMLLMFASAIPTLIILGWIYTFKMAKIMEFLNIKFSTHYSKLNMDYQERQTTALESIDRKLNERI